MVAAKVVFGGGGLNRKLGLDPEKTKTLLDALKEEGIQDIDTARIYRDSEELLGLANASAQLTICTQMPAGMSPKECTRDVVVEFGKESLQHLGTKQVSCDPKSQLQLLLTWKVHTGRYLLPPHS